MVQRNGVVYLPLGEEYVNEALDSAKSLKRHSDISITMYSDVYISSPYVDECRVIDESDTMFSDRYTADLAPYLQPNKVPYDNTLFLDSDTYICEDITNSFDILNNFDIAATHNPGSRTESGSESIITKSVPEAFPRYNGGVLFFKDNKPTNDFFDRWRNEYEKYNNITAANQPTLRKVLYEEELSIGTLPSEYNLRIKHRGSVGFMADSVKILHGRHPAGLETIAERLNQYEETRVYTMKRWPIDIHTRYPSFWYYTMSLLTNYHESYLIKDRLINSLKDNGIKSTVKKIIRNIKNTKI